MSTAGGALRANVRLLGELLGRVLVEQEGSEVFEAEETIRLLSREARARGGGAASPELTAAVRALTPRAQARVLRAFGLYFQLANIAEQHHRVGRPSARRRPRRGASGAERRRAVPPASQLDPGAARRRRLRDARPAPLRARPRGREPARCILPAWFGCGSAFAAHGLDGDVDNLEMTLAKTSLGIAESYLELVPPAAEPERLFRALADEHERAVAGCLAIVEALARSSTVIPRSSARSSSGTLRRPDERDPGRAPAPPPGRRRGRAPSVASVDRRHRGGA